MALLDVRDLSVAFRTSHDVVTAVRGIDLNLDRGETLAIVGESGSGKSQTVFAVMGLLAANGTATGSVRFDGEEILGAPPAVLNRVRAVRMAMIFQDPMSSLNPFMRISDQLAEVLVVHKGMTRRAALAEAVRMLDAVRIPDARSRIGHYPHEFSGGMRQRVMIAMALLCRPDILIADEPTTALDVTVQAQILKLLADLRRDFGMAMILITHDLGVVANAAERMIVMYGGQVLETGPVEAVYGSPSHPYTRALLRSVPRLDTGAGRLATIPGNPPNMSAVSAGCPFAPRCASVIDVCLGSLDRLAPYAPGRSRACNRPVEEIA